MKIFNIHLNKSGSSSLTEAMRFLGFKSYHWTIKGKEIRKMVLEHGFDSFPRFDFLSDFGDGVEPEVVIPIVENAFPDAKFILTVRKKNDWIKSLEKHRKLQSAYFDKDISSLFYDRVLDYYTSHFYNKNSLLVLSTDSPNKWELLCNFLQKPIPVAISYPYKYSRKEKEYYADCSEYSTIEGIKEKNKELVGITSYFNPKQYQNKLTNYKIFRKNSNKQGLKLITVECAFSDQPFTLTKDDADILIQVRSSSVLWQKERLLNIGLNNLPHNCKYIAWVDSDIIFLNNKWVEDTIEKLEKYKVVQLFDVVVKLEENQKFTNEDDFPWGHNNSNRNIGFNYCFKNKIVSDIFPHTGFGWAIRKSIIKQIGFFDKLIIGSGDNFMANCFAENSINALCEKTIGLKEDEIEWNKKANELVEKSISYINGTILHLYHGNLEKRLYKERYEDAKKYNLSSNDFKQNDYGCWEWNTDKLDLIKYVEDYFDLRKEDNQHLFLNENKFETYEKLIQEIIDAHTDRRINFLQVGANDGKTRDPIYASLMKNKDKVNVLFVEPQSELIPKIENSYKDIKSKHIFNGGVGKDDTLNLYRIKPIFWELLPRADALTSANKEHVINYINSRLTNLPVPIEDMIECICYTCSSVDKLVEKYLEGMLDVLQVDAECFDDEVIYTCNLKKLAPNIINYEYKNLTKERNEKLEEHLISNGYKIIRKDKFDNIAMKFSKHNSNTIEKVYENYYEKRKGLKYYEVLNNIIDRDCGDTIIDIGANNSDIILMGNFTNRIVVDKREVNPKINNVKYITSDYLNCEDIPFADLVLCLQVLEHIEQPKEFAQKLLSQGKKIIVSIPFKWEKGKCKWHIQDPVDDLKMKSWFLKDPEWTESVTEDNGIQRKIYCYINDQ